MEEYTIIFRRSTTRPDLQRIRSELVNIAEAEATYLYRLAWRMQRHGCSQEAIDKCREEARELHMMARPELLLDGFKTWQYAFKI